MKGNGGFIKMVILIVIALVVLGFLGYDIRDVLNSPKVHDNLVTFWNWIVAAWDWIVDFIKGLLPAKR